MLGRMSDGDIVLVTGFPSLLARAVCTEVVRSDRGARVVCIARSKPAEEARYRAYRVLIHGIFVALVAFVLAGDWIVWGNCLTGVAWRTWLPAWFAVAVSGAVGSDPSIARLGAKPRCG